MTGEQLNRILDGLLERTKNKHLAWQTTEEKETYQAALGENSISVQGEYHNINLVVVKIELKDEHGAVFESSTSNIHSSTLVWEKVKTVFLAARDKALKISEEAAKRNEKINSILKQLEGEQAA